MELLMGIYDAPEAQAQPLFRVEPLKSHIAVFGTSMSGKTTFVKTLLLRLHEDRSQEQEEIYIIDFGGSLGLFEKLPNVCAYFDNSSEENIKRVFQEVEKRVKSNADSLGGRSYPEVLREKKAACPPHLTFIIENVSGFLADDRYETYRENLIRLCRDGLSKGLTVVATGGDTAGMGRLLSYFGQKIGFSLSADQYSEVFGCRVNPPMRLPGRGVANIGSRNYEFQCFLPHEGREEDALRSYLNPDLSSRNRKRMTAFPKVLDMTELRREHPGAGSEEDRVVVGLDYYDHTQVVWDHSRSRCVGIYGKRGFGKTNLLKLMLAHLRRRYPRHRFVYLDDGRLQLRRIMTEPFPADRKAAEKMRDQERARLKQNGYICFPSGEIYMTDVERFREFLTVNGYVGASGTHGGYQVGQEETGGGMKPLAGADGSRTVFIVDNKSFYPRGFVPDYHRDPTPPLERLVSGADEAENLLILADIRPMEREHNETLHRMLGVAFLLDNIGEFVADRGSKSVFGEMDAKELKSLYAKCELGDGYCYQIEEDELKKLKFLKAQG